MSTEDSKYWMAGKVTLKVGTMFSISTTWEELFYMVAKWHNHNRSPHSSLEVTTISPTACKFTHVVFFSRQVYVSTVGQHMLGTLEKEVRGKLIQQVKENKWKLSADIELDKLACLLQWQGHSARSLQYAYQTMSTKTMNKLGKKSNR